MNFEITQDELSPTGMDREGGREIPIRLQPASEEIGEIRRLVKDLAAPHPLRAIVDKVLAGQSLKPAELELVLDTAYGLDCVAGPSRRQEFWRWIFWRRRTAPGNAEQELAIWVLWKLEPAGVDRGRTLVTLQSLLKRDVVSRRLSGQRGTHQAGCMTSLYLVVLGIMLLTSFPEMLLGGPAALLYLIFLPIAAAFAAFPFMLLMGIPTLLTAAGRSEAFINQIRWRAALALWPCPHLSCLEPLLAAAAEKTPGLSQASFDSLMQVLPLLTPDHYGRMPPQAVPLMADLLAQHRWWGDQGVLALLDALGRVGDGRAVPAVEQLLNSTWSDAKRDRAMQVMPMNAFLSRSLGPEVRSEAERVLAILKERRRREEDYGMLLRGSQPAPQPDTLLRPAQAASPEIPAWQLLRAAQSQETQERP